MTDQPIPDQPERPTLVAWLTENQRAVLTELARRGGRAQLAEMLTDLEPIDVVTTEYVNALLHQVSFRARVLERLTGGEWYAALAPRNHYENQWVPMRTFRDNWQRDWDREPENMRPEEVEFLTKVAQATHQPYWVPLEIQ